MKCYCDKCNQHYNSGHYDCQKIVHVCSTNVQVNKPNLLDKAINFTGAVVNHIAEGFKSATKEQIDLRYEICKKCELFEMVNEQRGICQHAD